VLQASRELADRVVVVFTDGEAHDSLPPIVTQAQRLKADGTHLILVAEGGRSPTRIPMRDDHGGLLGYQKDEDGRVIETVRRDDLLGGAADAAQGTLVAADLPDQAGAVRDLVASYRRARASETRTEQSRPRAWLPLLLAVGLLVAQAASRRTAALVGLAIACLVALPARNVAQQPPLPRSLAEKAWDRHDLRRARVAYLAELVARRKEDAAWYNAGTAALADSDAETARASLAHAAASLDPDLRFRALYNLGLLALQQADDDTAGRDAHLADAERAYREALLLRPRDRAAKWNLELAVRHRGGSSQNKAPPSGGGGSGPPGGGAGGPGPARPHGLHDRRLPRGDGGGTRSGGGTGPDHDTRAAAQDPASRHTRDRARARAAGAPGDHDSAAHRDRGQCGDRARDGGVAARAPAHRGRPAARAQRPGRAQSHPARGFRARRPAARRDRRRVVSARVAHPFGLPADPLAPDGRGRVVVPGGRAGRRRGV